MIEALEELPVHIFNLTSDDTFMWKRLSATQLEQTRIISTNLVPMSSSEKKPLPFVVFKTQSGARIAFLGMADPVRVKPNSGFRGVDPATALAEVQPQLLQEADLWIVIGDLTQEQAEALAAQYDPICAVLLMHRSYRLLRPRQVNNAVICESVERGRYLGQLKLRFDAEGALTSYEPQSILLGSDVPEDTTVLQKVEQLKSVLP